MDHSLAQTISLQCPQCGASFTAAVWLIVDAAARPELLARVADGSLHTLVCPNGHGGEVDAPLLLFRPGETPALLFSPARQTTAEQDAEQAQGLIGQLRETLGGAWRDEWLGQLSPLPREALAALARGDEAAAAEVMQAAVAAALPPGVARALADIAGLLAAEGVRVESAEDLERALAARPELRRRLEAALRAAGEGTDDEPAAPPPPAAAPPPLPPGPAPEEEELPPLLQALADFVNARTWLESYQFLQAHPELLSDELDALLGELLAEATASGQENDVRLLTEHRALLQRSRAAGAAAAFAEKMGTTAEQLEAATQAATAAAAIPPETRRALDEIMAALAAEGVRPGSPEELQAALAARPELAAKLAAAADSAGQGGVEVPDDVRAALGELATLNRPEDMPRRVALLREALRRPGAAAPAVRAALQVELGNALAQNPQGERAANLEEAIAAYRAALAVYTRAAFPEQWAMTQNNLGNAYADRIEGERAANLEAAIAAYRAALAVYTRAAFPADWAMTHNNLGNAYADRIRGERAANLEAAIAAYRTALEVRTRADFPADWAMTQNNLGNAYRDRIRGERAANLEAAIAAYRAALEVRTRAAFPEQWATTQNNLGNAYADRIEGDRAANLEEAIAAYRAALEVRTRAAFPEQWATTQNNLAAAYANRIEGDRAANLEEAIAAYRAALEVYTRAAFPEQWATAQNNLAAAYADRIQGERAANLEEAIAAYRAALEVYTRAAFPADWAMTQNNLGTAYFDRIRGERAANLEAAIAAFRAALDAINESFLDVSTTSIIDAQSRWAGLYARTVRTLLQVGRAGEALAVAEGSKSRLLTLLMSRGDLAAPPVIPTALIAQERAAAAALNAIDTASLAGHNRVDSEPGESIRRRGEERAAIVAQLRAAWEAMAALGPAAAAYVALRRGDRPSAATLARLAGELPPGVALLSIFDPAETVPAPEGEEGMRQRLLLFLWPAGEASPRLIETAIDPDALRYDYLANYEDEVLGRGELARLGRPVTQRWRGLGLPLFGPLRPYLDGIDHLIISPESFYHQLPLHALWLSDAGDTLLDHCAVSTIPALGLLERLQRHGLAGQLSPATGDAAVLGYTDAPVTTERGKWERAIFEGEARAVAARLGVAPLLDDAATSEGLEKATAAPLRVLHLSCHGGFSPGDALASGVLLADGVYTARRFLERRLAADLVTLSACQTGLSGSLGGDEMAGLSMALLSAGAASLLLGLWSVNAVTTALLMDDFYARLDAGGVGKAEALRRTMLAFRAGAIAPLPAGLNPADAYYWAPFVLVGDWR